MKLRHFVFLGTLFMLVVSCDKTAEVTIDLNDKGRTFQGLGGVSAGASSELLFDYPQKQRDEILDFLFKPFFGASLQQLKVEIGGDMCVVGSEPSHARTLKELNKPIEKYYRRGYEYWLMSEAKKRNPEMIFSALEWGIPGYLQGHWTKENAQYIIRFIKGAKEYWDVDMQYISPGRNESTISTEWLTDIFKPALIDVGLENIKILAPDNLGYYWEIFDKMINNPELTNVIDAVGYHYICCHLPRMDFEDYAATVLAKDSGIDLWASEDWSMHDPGWDNAHILVGIFNKMYIRDRITAMQIWCPVDGYYDNVGEWKSTGLMKADQPWTGYYEVSPAIWAAAHIGQFISSGWQFLDKACKYFDDPSGGNYTSLKSQDGKDYSMIFFIGERTEKIIINVPETLPNKKLYLWKSNEKEQFTMVGEYIPVNGKIDIKLYKNSVYSLTTTTGQNKGSVIVKESAPFPMPYCDNFDNTPLNGNPAYFADIDGSFETKQSDNGNKYLEQQVTDNMIDWTFYDSFKPQAALTEIGDPEWKDYSVSVDAKTGNQGYVQLIARMTALPVYTSGIVLRLHANGYWELFMNSQYILASGYTLINDNDWHKLEISCCGKKIIAKIDNVTVADLENKYVEKGMVGLGSTYNKAKFDNLKIEPVR